MRLSQLLSLLAFLFSACTARTNSSHGLSQNRDDDLDLHDVSMLFPYKDLPVLLDQAPAITERQAGHSFVPPEILRDLDRALQSDNRQRQKGDQDDLLPQNPEFESKFFQSFGSFRMASLRLDPCANPLEHEQKRVPCRYELRIVWQIMNIDENNFIATDAAVHTVYELSHEEFSDLVRGLRKIKAESSAKMEPYRPLGPQPMIKAEGASSPSFKKIQTLIRSFANTDHLRLIAGMGDTAPMFSGHWPMLALDIHQGHSSPRDLVDVKQADGKKPLFVQRIDGAQGGLNVPSPVGLESDPFLGFGLPDEDSGKKQAYLSLLDELENPRRHDFSQTDCASCHMARTEKLNTLDGFPGLKTTPFTLESWNLSAWTDGPEDRTSLQMFSFFRDAYAISQRTINESAVAADLIKREFPAP